MEAESKPLDLIIFDKLHKVVRIPAICCFLVLILVLAFAYYELEKTERNLDFLNDALTRPSFLLMDTPEWSLESNINEETRASLDNAFVNMHENFNTLEGDIQKLKIKENQSILTIEQSFEDYFKTRKAYIDQIVALNFHPDELERVWSSRKMERDIFNEINGLYEYYGKKSPTDWKIQILLSFLIGGFLAIVLFRLMLRPLSEYISRTLEELVFSQMDTLDDDLSLDKSNQEQERSIKQLKTLNSVMEQSLLFARIDPHGYIISTGSKFSRFFNYNPKDSDVQFSTLIAKDEKDQEYFNSILNTHKNTGWQGEIKGSNPQGEQCWFEISINPYHNENNNEALLVICFDITQRKNAQYQINEITKEHFELEISKQKELSSKIIESQEKEQNRIAKDIHDGIGQMLTGLKFTIESIETSNINSTRKKIEQLKTLTSEIITGVRTATFNLSPPELADYGIAASLFKLSQELSKFTGKEIFTINKTAFNLRLEPLVEINIYRIVQEAVNNAIKYADSPQIVISISHSDDMLSIIIDDNGKGFNVEQVKTQDGHSGMGLTFMNERIAYLNGRLFITSNEKVGTRVTLNIPI